MVSMIYVFCCNILWVRVFIVFLYCIGCCCVGYVVSWLFGMLLNVLGECECVSKWCVWLG